MLYVEQTHLLTLLKHIIENDSDQHLTVTPWSNGQFKLLNKDRMNICHFCLLIYIFLLRTYLEMR